MHAERVFLSNTAELMDVFCSCRRRVSDLAYLHILRMASSVIAVRYCALLDLPSGSVGLYGLSFYPDILRVLCFG